VGILGDGRLLMAKVALVISVILNFFFVLLLFFRSALNDIVKEYWQQRCKRKEIFKNHLIELRKRILTLQRLECLILINQAVIKYDTTLAERSRLRETQDSMLKECGQAHQYISDNEVHYPKDIRELYKKYQRDFSDGLVEIIQKGTYKEHLLEMTDILSEKLSSLMISIDGYLT